jgi:hypothetical protein
LRERGYRVPVYLTLEEKEDLHEKASAACMDHNRFIRMLISGYEPRPAPDDRFYEVMDLVRVMGDRLEQLQNVVKDEGSVRFLEQEAEKWHLFQQTIEQRYLIPDRRKD